MDELTNERTYERTYERRNDERREIERERWNGRTAKPIENVANSTARGWKRVELNLISEKRVDIPLATACSDRVIPSCLLSDTRYVS